MPPSSHRHSSRPSRHAGAGVITVTDCRSVLATPPTRSCRIRNRRSITRCRSSLHRLGGRRHSIRRCTTGPRVRSIGEGWPEIIPVIDQGSCSWPDRSVETRTAIHSLLLSFLLALASGLATAQVYRSVDEKGNVIYSDKPPPDAVESTPVEIQPGPTEAQVQEAQERVEADRERLEAQRALREAEEAKRREERARRAEAAAAAQPQPGNSEDPDARAWWRYRGARPPPLRPEQPVEGSRVPTGDHPAFRPGF